MHAATGILTVRGGITSHAAVVARGIAKPAVVGCGGSNDGIIVDEEKEQLILKNGKVLTVNDTITIDGSTGTVYSGAIPTVQSGSDSNYQKILEWADKYKRMKVYANCETLDDVKQAVQMGAEGIGLCRTGIFINKPIH